MSNQVLKFLQQENQRLVEDNRILRDEVMALRDYVAGLRALQRAAEAITMEADPLALLDKILYSALTVIDAAERGIRVVGPAWASSRYAGGTGEPGPLTDLGRELLDVMPELGVGLDLSHLAERSALEALDRFEGVLMATHSNPRAIMPTDRHLTDHLIVGIAERDGVIGVVPFNGFLRRGWRRGDRKDSVALADVVRAIDYVCQRVGDADHVAIGSDFDGGFGSESVPVEIDTVADLRKIAAALGEHGFENEHIAAIMGGNWLRLLRSLLRE